MQRCFRLVLLGVLSLSGVWLSADDPRVAPVPPELREQYKLDLFYKKCLSPGGFAIVASDQVSDYALYEARYIVDAMLQGREDVRAALVKNQVRLAIMAPTEFTCDIPEHSDLTPRSYWNRRARGLGATPARPAVSCGEENLLALPGDPYFTEGILVHEFAHAIHEMGLNSVDPTFDKRLDEIYKRAMEDGLWKEKYAATNRMEYWAEGVQSWFGTNRENDRDHNHVNSRPELEAYDPRLARLIREAFPGNDWQYVRPDQRSNPSPHLEGFDRLTSRKFAWPAELDKSDTR